MKDEKKKAKAKVKKDSKLKVLLDCIDLVHSLENKWLDALMKATLLAIYTFVMSLVGMGVNQILTNVKISMLTAGLTALAAFMTRLLMELGISTEQAKPSG